MHILPDMTPHFNLLEIRGKVMRNSLIFRGGNSAICCIPVLYKAFQSCLRASLGGFAVSIGSMT